MFKETSDDNLPNFFHSEVANSNISLMLNVDWFQPYKKTIYSIGIIYTTYTTCCKKYVSSEKTY